MSNQLGVIGPKYQDLVISFCLGERETIPQVHLIDLQIISEIFLLQDKTGQINNLTGKYIMEPSKFKHIQRYMTTFELDYIKFELLPQRHQLSTILQYKINESFETTETAYV